MIAHDKENTIYATLDDWSLIQNSAKLAAYRYINNPPEGWCCEFYVKDQRYIGKGWTFSNPEIFNFITNHRKVVPLD